MILKKEFNKNPKVSIFLLSAFLVGLVYILIPGPSSIENFPGLPNSTKSRLEGDTIQNPNIAAYFSNFRRDYITNYYRGIFSKTLIPNISLPVISLNHPPESAFIFVRDQQESTFLEEYIFPMREAIFVNGYEPKVENDMFNKRDRSFVGDHLFYDEKYFNSKTTLRFYPSNIFIRVVVYIGSWIFILMLFNLWRKAIKQ